MTTTAGSICLSVASGSPIVFTITSETVPSRKSRTKPECLRLRHTAKGGLDPDYDNDGFPDLFQNYLSNDSAKLFHNERDGTFHEVTHVIKESMDLSGDSHAGRGTMTTMGGWIFLRLAMTERRRTSSRACWESPIHGISTDSSAI